MLRLEAQKKAAQEGTKGWPRWDTIFAERRDIVLFRVEARLKHRSIIQSRIHGKLEVSQGLKGTRMSTSCSFMSLNH